MTPLSRIKTELENLGDLEKKEKLQKYFKTGKGEYGEGDIFLWISVGEQRKIAKRYRELEIQSVEKLLHSKIHEYRLVALLILVEKFKKANQDERKNIVELYLNNTEWINNWDLVDLSAHKILGEYLKNKTKTILYNLAESEDLWERRISIISTFALIRNGDYNESLKIAEMLLNDEHDLIHKAVGWMLREVGKRDQVKEEAFLMKFYKTMPRTMLRYSIEKFDKNKKQFYMKKCARK
jgi:3-methyladenine DNA glycosylase AlkD